MTPRDLQQLEEIGLTAVFDLRSARELDEDGIGPIGDGRIRHQHVPFHSNPGPRSPAEMQMDLFSLYEQMLEQAAPCISTVFTALAEDDTYPAVFHCAAGKDRTGIISGLVLSALGVPEQEIITDYALTDNYMADRLEALRKSAEFSERYRNINPTWLRAEPQTMANTISLIEREHGSIEAFLYSCNVTADHIGALRENLLA